MSDDLITSLRALAAARHDDLSIAVDAVIEIERLRAEVERLIRLNKMLERNEREFLAAIGLATTTVLGSGHDPSLALSSMKLVMAEVDRQRAENEKLREALSSIRIDGPDYEGVVWVRFVTEGDAVRAHVAVGNEHRMVSRVALHFKEAQRAAMEGKP